MSVATNVLVAGPVVPVRRSHNVSDDGGVNIGDGRASLVGGHDRAGRERASRECGGLDWCRASLDSGRGSCTSRGIAVRRRNGRGWSREGGRAGLGRERGAFSGDRRRGRRSGAIVVLVTRAQSDGDDRVLRASLHAIGIIGRVAVCLLLGGACAGRGRSGDLPVAVPRVAIDVAQVVPDDPVGVEGVLILHDVCHVRGLRQLERPAIAVGKLGPRLIVGAAGLKNLVNLLETTISSWGVVEVDFVAAGVVDNGLTHGLGESRGGQEAQGSENSLHLCDW